MNTGALRMVDLHDRRFLLYHQVTSTTGSSAPTYNLILSLEPYSSTRTAGDAPNQPFTFNSTSTYNGTARADNGSGNPGDLMNRQMISMALQTKPATDNDDVLLYQVTYNRHRQAESIPNVNSQDHWTPFLGLTESNINVADSVTSTSYLRKGDMACLCLDYGHVSPAMQEVQAEKYWNYQQTVAANPTAPVDPELAEGQLLYIMGQSYYNKVDTLVQNVESWTKTHAISLVAHGLTKLSPLRNSDDTPKLVSGDLSLRYPRVDMSYQRAAWVGSATVPSRFGDEGTLVNDNASQLIIGGGSADEHNRHQPVFFSSRRRFPP